MRVITGDKKLANHLTLHIVFLNINMRRESERFLATGVSLQMIIRESSVISVIFSLLTTDDLS